jgi:hypothetical protein
MEQNRLTARGLCRRFRGVAILGLLCEAAPSVRHRQQQRLVALILDISGKPDAFGRVPPIIIRRRHQFPLWHSGA